jgi:hypothetical protein
MVVLLRHAHAIGKQSWRGSDAHRPLSALGQEQAAGLVDTLTGVELRVLYCSPTTAAWTPSPRWPPPTALPSTSTHSSPRTPPPTICSPPATPSTSPAPCGAPRSPHAPAPTGHAHSPSVTPQRVGPGCSMPTPRRATSIPIRRSRRLRRWGSPLRKCNERLRAVDPGDPATLPSVTQVTSIRGSVGVTLPALPDTVRIAADAGPAAPE